MSEQEPFIQIDEDDIPDVLTKDRLPVLKTMITDRAQQREPDASGEFLKAAIDKAFNHRLNQLADMIETHFSSLSTNTTLSPSDIGRELANVLRAPMPLQDQEEEEANRLQYLLFTDLHDGKQTK